MPTPQAVRTERTRERLLDATLTVVADEGMAKATTARICEVAGVSRGAQTHHFPTKHDLIIAALERMAERYEEQARQLIERLAPPERTIDVVVTELWRALDDDRFGSSALEALVHGRTDTLLRPAVTEANAAAIAAVRSFGSVITHPEATSEVLADSLETTLHYFRGLALSRPFSDVDGDELVASWLTTLRARLVPLG